MNYSKSRLSWELYKTVESSFFDFLEYVPLTREHEKVISPKLLTLIFQIGGYVDTTFKHMAQYPRLSTDPNVQKILEKLENPRRGNVTIEDCRVAFEPIYKLSEREVIVKSQSFFFPESIQVARRESYAVLTPFLEFRRGKSPKWWKIYTGLKHYSLEKIKDATMKNTLDALSGLFLLNVIDEQNWPSIAWEVVQGTLHQPSRVFEPRDAYTKLFYFEWKEKIQSIWPEDA